MTNSSYEFENDQAQDPHLETIALLQEEIARLEAELLAQQAQREHADEQEHPSVGAAAEPARADEVERDRLKDELASRDETITLLLEQLRLVEESERATREEWEQLAGWLAEVEERVERRDHESSGGTAEQLAALQREADEARAAHARDRGAWDRERRELAREHERLAALAAEQAAADRREQPGGDRPDAAWKLLESENEGLRQHCRELEADCQRQVQALSEALESTRRELDEAGRRVAAVEDERARERKEFEVALASIRAQSIRASLHAAHEGPAEPPHVAVEASGALEADVRIREFRQHLREIHDQEEEARNRKRLGARLSRLWSRTAPSTSGNRP